VHTPLHPRSTAAPAPSLTRRRVVPIAIAAALCLTLSASGSALAAPPGDTKADYPGTAPAVTVGDTPADFARPSSQATKTGDTPVDDPGASRAPRYTAPAIITVNRPERTIVRDADEPLPMMFASAALLIALAGVATALVRTGARPRLGRSH
jgi:hypothetical protein